MFLRPIQDCEDNRLKYTAELRCKGVLEQRAYLLAVVAKYAATPCAQDQRLMPVGRRDGQDFMDARIHGVADLRLRSSTTFAFTAGAVMNEQR